MIGGFFGPAGFKLSSTTQRIIDGDALIDELSTKIEEDCIRLIALQ